MNNDDKVFNNIKNKINVKKQEHFKSIVLKIVDIIDSEIRKKNIIMNITLIRCYYY